MGFSEMAVISSYSREQAIEDGVLVDLTAAFPREANQYYKVNVCCTSAVWNTIQSAVTESYDVASVVYDVIVMSRFKCRKIDECSHLFVVTLDRYLEGPSTVLKVVCGPGDDAEPVITILEPHED